MSQLAIKGHATRGKEIIQLLEMLGGKNIHNYVGTSNECYAIDDDKICTIYTSVDKIDNCAIFTLEQFEQKFPYKVGDKVKAWINGYHSICNIQNMQWDGIANEIKYKIQDYWYSAMTLQPYKEETMKQIKIDIPKGYGFAGVDDDKQQVVFEKIGCQYPKTFIEVLNFWHPDRQIEDDYQRCYKKDLIEKFQDLLYARDAYWKISGKEMGLGKSWEYDMSKDEFVYAIVYQYGYIQKNEIRYKNAILAFPTKEMRDAFYENFKDLIEQCKELL